MSTFSDILEYFRKRNLTDACSYRAGRGVVGTWRGLPPAFPSRHKICPDPLHIPRGGRISVGGKTAVNLTAGKNLAGVFQTASQFYVTARRFVPCRTELLSMGFGIINTAS
jgi:3-dehydroquinate synthase